MFGKPTIFKEHAGLIRELETGARRPAEHVRPTAVTDSGFESFATPDAQAIFSGFEYFAALLNQHVADPWTVEEQGKTLLNTMQIEGPALGRTYVVFYNGVNLGKIQVTAGFHVGGFREGVEWHLENRAAIVFVELDYLRFVPFNHALSLISSIEFFVGPFQDGDTSRTRARLEASASLTGYLWEAVRYDDLVAEFYHRIEGPYDLLKQTTDHWKAEGVDPFERWGGDRLS